MSGSTSGIAPIEQDENQEWWKLSSTEKTEVHKLQKCYIYRVPEKFKVSGASSYQPSIISIGPYHRHRNLEVSKAQKKHYFNELVSRSPREIVGAEMRKSVRVLEAEARNYYGEEIKLEFEEFVQMLVLDGCFILELFYRYYQHHDDQPKKLHETDILFRQRWILPTLRRDLVLLENQIPYTILDNLFDVLNRYRRVPSTNQNSPQSTTPTQPSGLISDPSLFALVVRFFQPILPTLLKETIVPPIKGQGRHLLDVLRSCLIQPRPRNFTSNKPYWEHTTSATSLQNAGVKFKKRTSEEGLLQVKFENGTLEIPSFFFGKSWTVLLRNMIAQEQCYGDNDTTDITCYVVLMDNLINTGEDVKLLREKEIIEGGALEDDTIAEVVNSLCKDVALENIHYDQLCHDLNAYRKKSRNLWKADLKKNYFNNPWRGASVFAAVLLLGLTSVQTIYTILSYYKR